MIFYKGEIHINIPIINLGVQYRAFSGVASIWIIVIQLQGALISNNCWIPKLAQDKWCGLFHGNGLLQLGWVISTWA